MRSPADGARAWFEYGCRAVAVGVLALLLWRALRPEPGPGTERVQGAQLASALDRWTRSVPESAVVVLDGVPDARTRDWLRAIAGAGTAVGWATAGGDTATGGLPVLAASAEPLPSPRGGVRVRLAATQGLTLALRDGAGLVDSLAAERGGATVRVGELAGVLDVRSAAATARTFVRDSLVLRPVLVIGTAGWEGKFTIAALEEAGWTVHARLRVSPAAQVTQGPALPIDTARYAAVVALDSVAGAEAAAIARFVRQGGGLVLAGAATRVGAFAALRAGGAADRVAGIIGAERSDSPRDGLTLIPVSAPRGDAIPLESRGRLVAVAARRVEAGRVVQAGFEDTWRWRMLGADGAVAAHRGWWSELVSAVAYAPRLPREGAMADASPGDEAPLAALVDALGPPVALADAAETGSPDDDASRESWLLFTLLAAALLAEWGSRRLRGAR